MGKEEKIAKMADEIYETLMMEAECPLSGMDCAIIADLLVGKGYCEASEVAREIVSIIEQRIATNKERKEGVQSTIWKAHYECCIQAYTDIKEIIEQKYTEGER